MELLVDPFIITLPPNNSNDERILEYLSSLGQWTRLVAEQEHQFWFSESALLALWETDQYPRYDRLADLLFQAQVEVCDIGTAMRAFEILSSPPYLEDEMRQNVPEIQTLHLDEKNTVVIPEEIANRLEPQVAEGLCQTLSWLAYSRQYKYFELAEGISFATCNLDNNINYITVQGECYQESEDKIIQVDGKWLTVCSPDGLLEQQDLMDFWRDTKKAIEWAFNDLVKLRVLDPASYKLPCEEDWDVGENFNVSIEKNHFDRKEVLVEIFYGVVKVLVEYWPRGVNSSENHALQRDHHQIRRKKDSALAWRAYVTRYPPKIRLHYWVTKDGTIELSKIVVHNDFKIE